MLLATQAARAVTGVESAENAQFRHREPTAAPAVLALLPGVERAVTAMGDPSIGPVLERYSSAVRSVEASLQVGDTAGALRIEQTAENPAADQLIGVVSRFAASQSARADRGLRHADRLALAVHVGTVGLVAAILGLLWLFGVRAERARRRLVEFHEARFRTVVSRGTDAIALVEPSGLVLFASDSCEEVLGSHPAALEGKLLLEAFPRDERERVSGALAAVRTRPEQPVVIRIVVEDPDLRFLEITTVSKLGDPTVRAIVVNVRDITRRRLAEMALGRSEALLRELLDWAPVLVYVKDLDGRFLKVNKAWLQATGLSQEQAIGSIASEILPRRDAELDAAADRAALRGGGYQAEEVVSLAGQRRVLLTARFPLVDGDGATYAVGGISMDITDRVRLRETERLLDAVVTHSTDAIFGVREGQITSWNPAAEELLGYTADEVIGTPAASLFASAGLEDEQASRLEEVQSGAVIDASLVTCLHRNGTPVRAELTTTPVHDSEGRSVGVSAILHAVSDLPSQASGASGVDELTGLPTWASLVDQMAQILNLCALEGSLGGVLFVDLDEFGLVNDSLGHDAGDEVLRVVADRLRRAIRSGDLLARHGGDEFVVVRHPVSDRDELVEYAGRLCQVVAEPVKYRDDTLVVTASVGVALTPARNTMLWVQDAGFAMQEAKRAGGAKVHLFDETIASQVRDRITLRNDLRHAVDNAAVVAHYQPVLDLRTGHLAGFEALARWRHPQRGWVAPDTFIPLAEETGVIVELGLAMARQACEQLVTWQYEHEAVDLEMAFNVSSVQLRNPAVVSAIGEILSSTGADPSRLILEITESTFAYAASVGPALSELRGLGLQISIDDFGTGYSSMSYLTSFPVTRLKIDRSFVARLGTDPRAQPLLAGIISLAHSLDLRVTAEGVETQEQSEWLALLGCEHGQGYLWSRPKPPDELTGWLTAAAAQPPGITRPVAAEEPAPPEDLTYLRVLQLRHGGASNHTIAAVLNREGIPRQGGTRWSAQAVAALLVSGSQQPRP